MLFIFVYMFYNIHYRRYMLRFVDVDNVIHDFRRSAFAENWYLSLKTIYYFINFHQTLHIFV